MINRLGIELRDLNRPARPITMPAFNLPVVDDGAERREIAARFAEHRIVAKGPHCVGSGGTGRAGNV
jgi:hypothetical protein